MFKVVNWDYKQLKENLPLLGAVRHIPRLKDTLDSKRLKIEIDAILSVFHSDSFRYLG